jgi:hypothetical protein
VKRIKYIKAMTMHNVGSMISPLFLAQRITPSDPTAATTRKIYWMRAKA